MAIGYMELADIIKTWQQIASSSKNNQNTERLILSTLHQLYRLQEKPNKEEG